MFESTKKKFYISKLEIDKENPKVIYSSDGELWIRPDIWKEFVSNSWIKGSLEN